MNIINQHTDPIRLAICAAGEIYGGVEQWVYSYCRNVARIGNCGKLREGTGRYGKVQEQEEKVTFPNIPKHPETSRNLSVIVILFYNGPLAEKLRATGIDVVVVSAGKYNPDAIRKVKRVLKEHSINVVHAHGYRAMITAGIAARRLGVPVVKTEHSVQEPTNTNQHEKKINTNNSRNFVANSYLLIGGYSCYVRMSFNLFLDRMATRLLASHVVYVSRFAEEKLSRYYGKKPSSVIVNGIEPFDFSASKTKEFADDRFHIALVGRLSEVKGHRYAIEAVALLSKSYGQLQEHTATGRNLNIILHFFGSGSLEQELQAHCAALGIEDRVVFHGFCEQLADMLAQCDLLIMPSLFESLPYTLLEGMFANVPIVASRVGGIPEVIENGVHGILIEPENSEALAAAIANVYQNRDAARARTHAAKERVEKEFMIGTMIEKYYGVYGNTVQNRNL